MLELCAIHKSYTTRGQRRDVLCGVSLQVQAGEFVALCGPSGSGKTTLLLTAGGLLQPDAGSVRLRGDPVYGRPAEALAAFRAENIGFVFQQFHLVPYLTVLQNVIFPSLAARVADAQVRARKLLVTVGLEDRLSHLPTQLSTGERQRVALARALLTEPRVILADEPTGNLDTASAEIVIDQLRLFSQGGHAVLMVTHEQTAAARASRVVQMAALLQEALAKPLPGCLQERSQNPEVRSQNLRIARDFAD